jgi:hypothetical protein
MRRALATSLVEDYFAASARDVSPIATEREGSDGATTCDGVTLDESVGGGGGGVDEVRAMRRGWLR